MKSRNGLTAIEAFCGSGGMALGLHEAGYDVRLAFDNDPKSVETYNAGLDSTAHLLDASEMKGTQILDLAEVPADGLDLLSGGPPCQGFSKQRRGAVALDDPRNRLVVEFVRLVHETKAKSFLFVKMYEPKYPKAAICLQKDRDEMMAFYNFPAQHWQSIRTSNPIESTFGTIRHRTRRSKGCLSRDGMLHMMFKLGQCAEKKWRRLRGFDYLTKVISGVKFKDGVEVTEVDLVAA